MRRVDSSSRLQKWWLDFFTENLSYKLVSLFIALILWLTILGRRDFVLSKSLEVEVLAGPGQSVVSQSVDKVNVKVSGPRMALRKFLDSSLSQQVTVDASARPEGEYDLEIPLNRIDVPFGVKVLQLRPASVHIVMKKTQ
jgi:YbbR domain-containing protein